MYVTDKWIILFYRFLQVINDILDISKINHDPKFKLENRRFSLRKCMKGKKWTSAKKNIQCNVCLQFIRLVNNIKSLYKTK